MQGKYRELMISEVDIMPVVSARPNDEPPMLDTRRWLTVACAALAGAAAGYIVFFG